MPRNPSALLSKDLWPEITKAAKSTRGHVAVAYVGRDAPRLLPLKKDSILVCDFSRSALERGLTHPDAIRTYLDSGVEIHSWENLHAKVFSFGDVAFVGSCNASANSAHVLTEAAVRITNPKTVNEVSEFVMNLRGSRVGPNLVDKLAPFYRQPEWERKQPTHSARRTTDERIQVPLWVAVLSREGSEAAQILAEQNMAEARRLVSDKSRFTLEWFEWSGRIPKTVCENSGEILLIDGASKARNVYAPARFIRMEEIQGKGSKVVRIEKPTAAAAISMARAERMLGEEFGQRLKAIRSSTQISDPDFAKHLRQLW